MHRHGAFRIHLVLHVSDIKMRVPMDEHFDIALHGFEGDEVKRVSIVLQYLLFLRPLFNQYVFLLQRCLFQ